MKNNIILFALLLMLTTSCEDFLMKVPHNMISDKNYFRNDKEVDAAVTGCYNALLKVKNSHEHIINEIRSDNATYPYTRTGVVDEAFTPSVLTVETTNTYVEQYWVNSYHLISRTNRVLENLDVVLVETQKKQMEAEVRFLRAWAYFNLVRYFGDIPLITKTIKNGKEVKDVTKSSIEKIYEVIIEDLIIADSCFTDIGVGYRKNYGRVNKWAVKSLLGKVYLTLGQNNNALPLIKDVYDNSGYKLTNNYGDLFVESLEMTKGAEEIIFPIRFTTGGLGMGNSFSTDCAFIYQNTYGNNYVFFSNALRDAYNMTSDVTLDKRYLINCSEVTTGHTVVGFKYPYRYLAKMVGLQSDGKGGYRSVQLTTKNDSGLDFPELRFAEVALIYAELLGEQDGLTVLNKVRERSGAPSLSSSDILTMFNGNFKEAVLNELRLELAGENKRYFDLLRMGSEYALSKLTTKLQTEDAYSELYFDQAYNLVQEVLRNGQVDEWRLLLPIPFNEIARSTALEQNPGYTR